MRQEPIGNNIFGERSDDHMLSFNHRKLDEFAIIQYRKDRTFNEMRIDLFFQLYGPNYDFSIQKINNAYSIEKNRLKSINGILYKIFTKTHPKPIWQILSELHLIHFNLIRPEFLPKVKDGRFITYNNSMDWHLLLLDENSKYYYSIIYC